MASRKSRAGVVTFKCEIRIRGRLSRALATEFEDLDLVATTEPVETMLRGPVRDQAALHGLIRRIEAFGLELVEVRRTPMDISDKEATDDP